MNRFQRRSAEKQKNKLFKLILGKFESVYIITREIGEHYGEVATFKLVVLKMVIDMMKTPLDGMPVEKELYLLVNKQLDGIYATCKKKSRRGTVMFPFLRHCIDVTKHAFTESYNGAKSDTKAS